MVNTVIRKWSKSGQQSDQKVVKQVVKKWSKGGPQKFHRKNGKSSAQAHPPGLLTPELGSTRKMVQNAMVVVAVGSKLTTFLAVAPEPVKRSSEKGKISAWTHPPRVSNQHLHEKWCRMRRLSLRLDPNYPLSQLLRWCRSRK